MISNLKERFELEVKTTNVEDATYLVVAVELPKGAIELITNTFNLVDKADYYVEKYDEEFRLKTCPSVKIIGYMLV